MRNKDLLLGRQSFGDCMDACAGTVLSALGMAHPELILFPTLEFTLTSTGNAKRPIELSTRSWNVRDYVESSIGLRSHEIRLSNPDAFRSALQSACANGRYCVVTVDHWVYPHSHFFRSGHMPHDLIVTEIVGDAVYFVDPMAVYGIAEVVQWPDFQTWCFNSELSIANGNAWYFEDSDLSRLDSRELSSDWRENVAATIANLTMAGQSDPPSGTDGIRFMAKVIERWLTDVVAEAGSSRPKFPVSSFLEVGGKRLGYAKYLRTVAELHDCEALEAVSTAIEKVGRYWNMLSALRHTFQEQSVADAKRLSLEFAQSKLVTTPKLCSSIADAESDVAESLSKIIAPEGLHT